MGTSQSSASHLNQDTSLGRSGCWENTSQVIQLLGNFLVDSTRAILEVALSLLLMYLLNNTYDPLLVRGVFERGDYESLFGTNYDLVYKYVELVDFFLALLFVGVVVGLFINGLLEITGMKQRFSLRGTGIRRASGGTANDERNSHQPGQSQDDSSSDGVEDDRENDSSSRLSVQSGEKLLNPEDIDIDQMNQRGSSQQASNGGSQSDES